MEPENAKEQSSSLKENSQQDEMSDSENIEDVPGDFFDDFLKEDFMSGLDIVDEDDEDEVPFPLIDYHVQKSKPETSPTNNEDLTTSKLHENSNETKDDSIKECEKTNSKNEEEITCTETDSDSRIETNNTSIQKNTTAGREINASSIVNDRVEKSREHDSRDSDRRYDKKVGRDGGDTRRDPDKTRRDIQRDKIRCEKDKEKKIISEKLQLVETGLVPPGMELEIDVKDIEKQSGEIYKSDENKKKLSPKQSVTSKNRGPSPKRRSRSSGFSNRSSTHRRRSPRPSPRRSPIKRRRSSPHDFRSSRGDYQNRSRYSPRNRRSRSRSPKRRRDEKKSFLEEIAEKLNETNPSRSQLMAQPVHNNYQGMQYIPQAVHVPQTFYPQQTYPQTIHPLMQTPVPTPVPAPNLAIQPVYQPAQKNYDTYDQSFFIGSASVNVTVPRQPQQRLPSPPKLVPTTTSKNAGTSQSSMPRKRVSREVAVSKLFHDKKITLSEFLAITAKPQVITSTRDYVREKMKVISRCQEAIKFLGGIEKKFTGKLIVKKSVKPPLEKYKSPLLKLRDSNIPFTQIPSESGTVQSKLDINRLLKHIGVKDQHTIEIDDSADEAEPPPPPQISMGKSSHSQLKKKENMFQQTSIKQCFECNQRKKKLFTSSGVQCDTPMTYSVSTQVTEEDFRPKIPKHQSLATMTPAQLLAKTGQTSKSILDQDPFMKQQSFSNRNPYGSPPFYNSDRGQGRGRGRGMQTFL